MEIICSNCGSKNKTTNIKCEKCGKNLNNNISSAYETLAELNAQAEEYYTQKDGSTIEMILKNKDVLVKIIYIICTFSFWFIALGMIIFGGLLYIIDQCKIRGFEKTIGTVVDFTDYGGFSNDEESCKAIFEYEVNGEKYRILTDYYATESSFKEQDVVMYNPYKPNEAYVIDRWYMEMLIIGIIILIIVIFIYCIINKIMKNIAKQEEKNTNAIIYRE